MYLFFIVITFASVIVAVCIGGIAVRVNKILTLIEENREGLASLETRLHQVNGTLIEIAALLRAQRPPA
jgi:hypothetical protein